MRLPDTFREHEPLAGWWVAGTGIAVIVMFVAMALPWHEVGRSVFDSELPRPRLHMGTRWGGVSCMGYEGFGMISVDRRGEPGVPLARLEAWVREERAAGLRSFYLRAHRDAPWSAVTRVLDAASRAGQPDIGLQIGQAQYLFLVLVDRPEPAVEEVTIASLPLPDPEGVVVATRERQRGDRGQAPVLHFDLASDPDVQSVLHALECYAGDDPRVHVAVRR